MPGWPFMSTPPPVLVHRRNSKDKQKAKVKHDKIFIENLKLALLRLTDGSVTISPPVSVDRCAGP